jgi:cobalt-zinc-cadmium efflux system outer membrane protein
VIRSRLLVAATAVATIAACVPSRAAMFGPVQDDVERRLGVRAEWGASSTDPRVPARVAELLTRPLGRDAAVRIAIANNRRLQARYDTLGIAAAAIAEATVLAPTDVDVSHKYALEGSGSETEIDVVQDVLGLLFVGTRRGIAAAESAASRTRAVAATVDLAARVEVAFYDLVAAQQELELRQTVFDSMSAAAEITERMFAAGNVSDLVLVRDRDQRERARVDLGRAQVRVEVRREALNELLGVSGEDTRWSVSWRLPDLPKEAPKLDDVEHESVAASLDLAALRADAEAASRRVGYARLRTVLPELGVGVSASRGDGGEWEAGPAVRFGLPIFDQQQGPRARAWAELRRARNEFTATAVELRARARAVRQRVLESYAEARHLRDVVLPLRQRVVDETLLHYNAMNATPFELLMARRDQVEAARDYIDALRRYWSASSQIAALRRGVAPMTGSAEPPVADSESPTAEH